MISRRAIIFLLSVFVVSTILLVACEPRAPFQIRNNTDQNLDILVAVTYLDHVDAREARVPVGSVEPSKVLRLRSVPDGFQTYLVLAKDSKGEIVYSKEFKVEELRKANWKVDITISP